MGGRLPDVPSARFGLYQVHSRLGEGGMAEVFLAETVDDRGDTLQVALKLLKLGAPAEALADEGDLMGLLSHPNLVRRLEVGTAGARPFIAMEYLVGGDLHALMEAYRAREQAFPRALALHIAFEVLKGLAYFHQAKSRTGRPLGLVHGDVNPANVFFSAEGDVKLGDFGVAKSVLANVGPADGVAAGKLHYLSPEQIRGTPLTPPSDLFSVGTTLYELALGRHPFRAEDAEPEAVMRRIRSAKVTLPTDVDDALALILRRSLHARLDSRYPNAAEFAGDLVRYALERGLLASREDLQAALVDVLGLVL